MHWKEFSVGSGMDCLNKNFYKFVSLAIGLTFIGGCTELGDIVVINYSIDSDSIKLEDFNGDFLTKDKLGKSPYCLTRRSVIDSNKWVGICTKPRSKKITIYRVFSNDFRIEKIGITKKILDSKGFEEISQIAISVESILNKKDIKFKRLNPKYIPFKKMSEEYKFTR